MMEIIKDLSEIVSSPCVATIGFFDGVHRGHRFLIDRVKEVAQEQGCRSALITFPTPPRQVLDPSFTPQLLSTFEEKEVLLAQTGVDTCFVLDFTPELSHLSAEQFMSEVLKKRFGVKVLVIGYDNHFGHDRKEGLRDYRRYGRAMGITVEGATPFRVDGQLISSSFIRRQLLKGDVAGAAAALGYPYYLQGKVVGGHQIGRLMGFPTANLSVATSKVIPLAGVYAVRVEVDGKEYGGMLNIGHRPTMDNGNDCSIEVNIFRFERDIYGASLRMSFVRRIRAEHKFDSPEALEQQLVIDREQVEAILAK
jgi:riboflavin kinase/FMN adenylyltransferase